SVAASQDPSCPSPAPAGTVMSWLAPASCSGGEPSRCSSVTSAGGGHGPVPSAAAITGYSIERPTGGIVTATPGADTRLGPIVSCTAPSAFCLAPAASAPPALAR